MSAPKPLVRRMGAAEYLNRTATSIEYNDI